MAAATIGPIVDFLGRSNHTSDLGGSNLGLFHFSWTFIFLKNFGLGASCESETKQKTLLSRSDMNVRLLPLPSWELRSCCLARFAINWYRRFGRVQFSENAKGLLGLSQSELDKLAAEKAIAGPKSKM